MSNLGMTALSIALLVSPAHAVEGLIAVPSLHSARVSMDRLEQRARDRGLKIFARIDHAAGARSIGEELRPTELMIFGHPKGGTPLLQCTQSFGIDLPMRVLAGEDEKGAAWLGYKDPATLGHVRTAADCDPHLKKLTLMLDALVREAALQGQETAKP